MHKSGSPTQANAHWLSYSTENMTLTRFKYFATDIALFIVPSCTIIAATMATIIQMQKDMLVSPVSGSYRSQTLASNRCLTPVCRRKNALIDQIPTFSDECPSS
jgi:hypothetical protein